MEKKEEFQVFPWSSNHEYRSVAKIVMNLEFNSNLLYNLDFLKDLQWIERQLTIWRTKTTSTQHLYEIDATHSIVNCLIHEHLPQLNKMKRPADQVDETSIDELDEHLTNETNQLTNCSTELRTQSTSNLSSNNRLITAQINSSLLDSPSFNLINGETIAVLYSNAVLKFFKMLSYYDVIDGKVERLLSRSEANLVRVCQQLDFPQYIIEYRHRIAHNKLPSFAQLKLASQIALSWLKRNYWSKYLNLLDDQEKSKLQIYEQTKMVLTSLFEVEEDVDTKLNKMKSLEKMNRNKKQKVDLKKFAILDRKEISLLNDTLYDLLTEDFYTTLHAITLYIVDSTKEHLNQLTVDEIRKWIVEDETNMNTILGITQHRPKKNELKTNDQPINEKSEQVKRKQGQLISSSILNSFRPIFEIINKQLSSINQLLFYLYSVIEDQQIDLKTSAQAWFVQIICALINNLNFSQLAMQTKPRINPLTEFEKCFKLIDTQLVDLKWIHLFTRLVEEPVMDGLNICVVKRFYPLVSFRYSKLKFNQICDLLSIYLDASDCDAGKKMKSNEDDLNEMQHSSLSSNDINWSKMKLGFV